WVPAFAGTTASCLARSRSPQRQYHGIAKRTVLPPPLRSTATNPVAAKPRLLQSPCSLVSNLLSRVQSCVVPPQFSGLFFYPVVGVFAAAPFAGGEKFFGSA